MASTGTRSSRLAAKETVTKVVKLPAASVGDSSVTSSAQANSKPNSARREVLVRQPSYCKILDDLKGTEAKVANLKEETIEVTTSVDSDSGESLAPQQVQTITINGQQYQIVNPSAIAATSTEGSIQTITVGGSPPPPPPPSSSTATTTGVVQYAATSQNGQTVFIPGTVAAASASGPQIISVATSGTQAAAASTAAVVTANNIEEATRKREIRLLKNREAARECRNKKKEYIKCLENRVAILENQNKALIEELKSLKELYTGSKQ